MGEVYRARDTMLQRDVALKLLPERATQNRTATARFIQEARAVSALNHPNIVTIYEIGEADEGQYIAMESVEGHTLRTAAAQGLSIESIVQLAQQAAKALAATHAVGIVHRDIKPENIMLRYDGYVKLLDFGLVCSIAAGALTIETQAATNSGGLLGTVRYMSPEQIRGEPVGTATDIFSLGIVLYEVATRQHPFASGSQIGVMHAILSACPVSPSQLNPEIPAKLEALILQMLEKDPGLRPSAKDVDAILARIEGKTSVSKTVLVDSLTRRHTVGREAELAELRAGFESAAASHGLLLCVPGEPGIGKTTLVEDFLAELVADNQIFSAARGRCSERLAGAEAYLPILEALENLLRSEAGDSIARMMKMVAPNWYRQIIPIATGVSLSSGSDVEVKATSQERMKRELGAFLQEVSRVRPLILFFDDLHWADISTVDMLAYVSTKITSMRMLVVTCYRPSDLLLANHPFLQTKLDLQARSVCRELPLDFLSRKDIERYLALEFPGHCFPAEFPALIHAKTEGSPLFMVDLLRYLRNREVIDHVQGRWALAQSVPELERELPESVRSMIQRKIDQLGDPDRRLLAAASVQGHEFDSAVVAWALQTDAVEVEERLDILGRVHAFVRQVRECELPDKTFTLQYRFVHVLYQNVLYSRLTPTRRASLSAAVAETLLKYYGEKSATIASDLAFLFEAARDVARASHYFLLAAQNAARVFANQEAVALSQRGLGLIKTLPDTSERRKQELTLLLTLARGLMAAKGWSAPEVELTYNRARALCEELGDDRNLFTVLWGLFLFYIIRADLPTARPLGERLLSLAQRTQEPTLVVQAHHAMGVILMDLGKFVSALEHFEQAIALYDPRQHKSYEVFYALDPGITCRCFAARVLWPLGYPDRAVARIDEALALARDLSDPQGCSISLVFSAIVHQFRREPQKTQEAAEKVIELATELGLVQDRVWGTQFRGWAVAEQGLLEEGIAQMRESLAAYRALGSEIARAHFLCLLAEALGKAGQIEEGFEVLAEALAVLGRTGERYYEAEPHRLKGELLLTKAAGLEHRAAAAETVPPADARTSLISEAEACFRHAIDIARHQEAKSWELRAAMSLSRLLKLQGKKEEARQMLSESYAWFHEGFNTADLREARELLEGLS